MVHGECAIYPSSLSLSRKGRFRAIFAFHLLLKYTQDVNKTTLLRVLLLLPLGSPASAQTLDVGDIAPDFALRYATKDSIAGEALRLSGAVQQSRVLLAFYPADWSSGCTKEVCGMRDDIASLTGLGIEVLGISGDYVYSHHAWAKHHDLPFRLLSDHRHDVARAYGSFNEDSGFTRRSVFVIDNERRIRYIDLEYSVRDDVDYQSLKRALSVMD